MEVTRLKSGLIVIKASFTFGKLINARSLTFLRPPLVKIHLLHYRQSMSLKKHFALPALIFCAASVACADTIQLKDQAAVTGKILAEKSDSVVVDVGYTVLVIPRNDVTKISKANEVLPTTPIVNPLLNVAPEFYTAGLVNAPMHDVSSLVKQIGEAVVQVRTPEGL